MELVCIDQNDELLKSKHKLKKEKKMNGIRNSKRKMTSAPEHVAIICDGNGRWATKRGLPRNLGHRAGTKPIKDITRECAEAGVKYLTLYIFSTENWNRPKDEVDCIMNLFIEFFRDWREEVIKQNIKIKHMGEVNNLSQELRLEIEGAIDCTKKNDGMVLNLALNYGSRSEIITSIKKISKDVLEGSLEIEEIDEGILSNYLQTTGQVNPDIIIRTSGESRVSNFLLWQMAKSEIWFTPVLWPDFKKEHLWEAFSAYEGQ